MNFSPNTASILGKRVRALAPDAQDVVKRKVFYISGFDPMGPRRYRELYRSEGAAQSRISGYDLAVSRLPCSDEGRFQWRAMYADPLNQTEAEFEFLGWDDIVRKSIRPSLLRVYALMFRTLWIYLSSGAIDSMRRLRRGPLIAGLGPAVLMMFYLFYAAMIATAVGLILAGPLAAPVAATVVGSGAAFVLAMYGTLFFEEQMMIYFMVNDLAYSAKEGGRYPKPLCNRLDAFADRIADALDSGVYDEVLVVGHSSGAQLAISAVSRFLERDGLNNGDRLNVLTLGQSIAMTSFLPEAHQLRADLARVADEPRIFWLDVTAPGDGACFALTDPVANCRQVGRPVQTQNPVVVSAAFKQTMEPGDLKRYRWRLLRMHFQYLCAFATPKMYDYFLITAGPLSLATRFSNRECSPSTVFDPISPVLHPG